MSLTAPNSAFVLEVLNVVSNGSAPGTDRAAASKTEMVPYCVPTARYLPVLEKQAAKLPLLPVSEMHVLAGRDGVAL
jgi:hypothetical protein